MLRFQRIWAVIAGAWVWAWIARALLDWVLGLGTTAIGVGVLIGAALGGVLGFFCGRELAPLSSHLQRDSILGWGGVFGGVSALACALLLPLPWGALAAIAVLAVTGLGLRQFAHASAPPSG